MSDKKKEMQLAEDSLKGAIRATEIVGRLARGLARGSLSDSERDALLEELEIVQTENESRFNLADLEQVQKEIADQPDLKKLPALLAERIRLEKALEPKKIEKKRMRGGKAKGTDSDVNFN